MGKPVISVQDMEEGAHHFGIVGIALLSIDLQTREI